MNGDLAHNFTPTHPASTSIRPLLEVEAFGSRREWTSSSMTGFRETSSNPAPVLFLFQTQQSVSSSGPVDLEEVDEISGEHKLIPNFKRPAAPQVPGYTPGTAFDHEQHIECQRRRGATVCWQGIPGSRRCHPDAISGGTLVHRERAARAAYVQASEQ